MPWNDARTPWPGEPKACKCSRMVVADLAETLDCPAGWYGFAGIGWVHTLGAGR